MWTGLLANRELDALLADTGLGPPLPPNRQNVNDLPLRLTEITAESREEARRLLDLYRKGGHDQALEAGTHPRRPARQQLSRQTSSEPACVTKPAQFGFRCPKGVRGAEGVRTPDPHTASLIGQLVPHREMHQTH